jgi:hypothetical protein
MPDYPEWVLKHKKKGTYINVVKGKYYLYAAHSERIKGTNKVRRVSDGYLGRITEEEGFIPVKNKLAEDVCVFEFGLSETIVRLCVKIHTGLKREFRANADYVFVCGAILFMYGEIRRDFYESSVLSLRFPGLDPEKKPTETQHVGTERTRRMIEDTLEKNFGNDCAEALALLPLIHAVSMAGEFRAAKIPEGVSAFCVKHGLIFEEV